MKSARSLTLIASLVESVVPVAAQNTVEATSPLIDARGRPTRRRLADRTGRF